MNVRIEPLSEVRKYSSKRGYVFLDIETTGLSPLKDRILFVTIGFSPSLGREPDDVFIFFVDSSDDNRFILDPIFRNNVVVGHNLIFDLSFLNKASLWSDKSIKIIDTFALSKLASKYTGQHSLAALVRENLNIVLDKDIRSVFINSRGINLSENPHIVKYIVDDVRYLGLLADVLGKRSVPELVVDIEYDTIKALALAECFVLDTDKWLQLVDSNQKKEKELIEQIHEEFGKQLTNSLFGFDINLNSQAQLLKYLKCIYKDIESTDDFALCQLEGTLPNLIRSWRSIHKLLTSYGADFIDYSKDGLIYPNWKPSVPRNGRISSENPNIQQIPKLKEYRSCFSSKTKKIIKADYSQMELRAAARITGDEKLLHYYSNNIDVHKMTSDRVVCLEDASLSRMIAKSLNFGLLYGMGPERFKLYLLANTGRRLPEDVDFVSLWKNEYEGIRNWQESIKKQFYRENFYIARTALGRERFISKEDGYTQILSTIVAGSCADAVKLAISRYLKETPSGLKLIATIHDELVFSVDENCNESETNDLIKWVKELMINSLNDVLSEYPYCPTEVEATCLSSWG